MAREMVRSEMRAILIMNYLPVHSIIFSYLIAWLVSGSICRSFNCIRTFLIFSGPPTIQLVSVNIRFSEADLWCKTEVLFFVILV